MKTHTKEAIRSHFFFKWLIVAFLLLAVVLLLLGGRPRTALVPTTIDTVTYLRQNGHVAFAGSGEPDATLALLANGKTIGEVVVGDDGQWLLETEKLAPGDYVFQVRNHALPDEAPATRQLTIPKFSGDYALPTWAAPLLGEDGAVILSGTGEPGATVVIFANGKKIGEDVVDADGKWELAAGQLPAGTYQFSAKTVDAKGAEVNEAAADSPFVVAPPTPSYALPTWAAPLLGEDGAVILSGTGEPGATVVIFANGKKIGEAVVDADGKWELAAGQLSAGTYQFSAKTVDAKGAEVNEAAADSPFVVALDCMPYVVQPGDWLTKLAIIYLDDLEAYTRIVDATNDVAGRDDSFGVIDDPDSIEAGQKICIPRQ